LRAYKLALLCALVARISAKSQSITPLEQRLFWLLYAAKHSAGFGSDCFSHSNKLGFLANVERICGISSPLIWLDLGE
jgi:hypothetical protein